MKKLLNILPLFLMGITAAYSENIETDSCMSKGQFMAAATKDPTGPDKCMAVWKHYHLADTAKETKDQFTEILQRSFVIKATRKFIDSIESGRGLHDVQIDGGLSRTEPKKLREGECLLICDNRILFFLNLYEPRIAINPHSLEEELGIVYDYSPGPISENFVLVQNIEQLNPPVKQNGIAGDQFRKNVKDSLEKINKAVKQVKSEIAELKKSANLDTKADTIRQKDLTAKLQALSGEIEKLQISDRQFAKSSDLKNFSDSVSAESGEIKNQIDKLQTEIGAYRQDRANGASAQKALQDTIGDLRKKIDDLNKFVKGLSARKDTVLIPVKGDKGNKGDKGDRGAIDSLALKGLRDTIADLRKKISQLSQTAAKFASKKDTIYFVSTKITSKKDTVVLEKKGPKGDPGKDADTTEINRLKKELVKVKSEVEAATKEREQNNSAKFSSLEKELLKAKADSIKIFKLEAELLKAQADIKELQRRPPPKDGRDGIDGKNVKDAVSSAELAALKKENQLLWDKMKQMQEQMVQMQADIRSSKANQLQPKTQTVYVKTKPRRTVTKVLVEGLDPGQKAEVVVNGRAY